MEIKKIKKNGKYIRASAKAIKIPVKIVHSVFVRVCALYCIRLLLFVMRKSLKVYEDEKKMHDYTGKCRKV